MPTVQIRVPSPLAVRTNTSRPSSFSATSTATVLTLPPISLENLTNLNIENPDDGALLMFDETSGNWIAATQLDGGSF